jgi:hypothetical protein
MGYDTSQEREAYHEQYGKFFAVLFEELLTLIEGLECRSLAGYEAKLLARSRFTELMREHVPSSHGPVARYRARVAEEEAVRAQAAAAYEEKRQALRAAEIVSAEREAVKKHADRVAASVAEEQRAREFRETFEREQRELQEKKEREEIARAEEAERLLLQIEQTH